MGADAVYAGFMQLYAICSMSASLVASTTCGNPGLEHLRMLGCYLCYATWHTWPGWTHGACASNAKHQ